MKTIRFADIDVATGISNKGKNVLSSFKDFADEIRMTEQKDSVRTKSSKRIKKSKYTRTYITTSTGVIVLNREVRTPEVQKSYPTATQLYWERANGTFSNLIKFKSICK